MHVLHYCESTSSKFGGPPKFVLDTCRAVAAEGHETTILTPDATDSPAAWLAEAGCRQEAAPVIGRLDTLVRPGGFLGIGAMRQVRRQLRNTDVVHLHGVWALSNLQVAAAARSMGVPYIVSLHGMLDDWCVAQGSTKKKVFLSLGGRYFLEKAARVHCTAQAEADQSKKWFPNGAEAIIPCLVDLEPYRDLPGPALARKKFSVLYNGDDPTVLFLSRLHFKKGPEFLLQAAANLKSQGVKGQVAFAGTGDPAYVESLKHMANKLGIHDRVHFLGMVVGREKLSLYQSADLFVLPTSQENFGLVLIEALACGTPVITTKGVDIWRDLQASGCAAISEQAPTELAMSIATILKDNNLRANMAAKSRPWVFREFDERALLRRFESMYEAAANATVGTAERGWRRVAPAVAHHDAN